MLGTKVGRKKAESATVSSVHRSRLVGGQPMTFKLPLEEGWEANLSTNAAQIKIDFRYSAIRQIENDFWVWEFCVLLAPVCWSEDDGAGTVVELFAPLFPKLKMISGPAISSARSRAARLLMKQFAGLCLRSSRN